MASFFKVCRSCFFFNSRFKNWNMACFFEVSAFWSNYRRSALIHLFPFITKLTAHLTFPRTMMKVAVFNGGETVRSLSNSTESTWKLFSLVQWRLGRSRDKLRRNLKIRYETFPQACQKGWYLLFPRVLRNSFWMPSSWEWRPREGGCHSILIDALVPLTNRMLALSIRRMGICENLQDRTNVVISFVIQSLSFFVWFLLSRTPW